MGKTLQCDNHVLAGKQFYGSCTEKLSRLLLIQLLLIAVAGN
jgi:hypothetical protein